MAGPRDLKRAIALAGPAFAALLAGSLWLLLRHTAPPPLAEAPPEPPPTVAGAPGAAGPPSAAPPPPTPLRSAGAPARARWKTRSEASSLVPMADRVTRKLVRRALLAEPVQSALSRCLGGDVGFGGGTASAPVPRTEPAALMLELETGGSDVRIVDARVRSWGGASAETVSCAREVLVGRVVTTPSEAEQGGHVQMPFPLSPRGGGWSTRR